MVGHMEPEISIISIYIIPGICESSCVNYMVVLNKLGSSFWIFPRIYVREYPEGSLPDLI